MKVALVVASLTVCLLVIFMYTCREPHLQGEKVYEKEGVYNPSIDKGHIAVRRSFTFLVNHIPYGTGYYYSTFDVYNSSGLQVIQGKEDWSVEDPRMILYKGNYLICLTAYDGQKTFHPVYYYKKKMHEYIMEDGLSAKAGNKNWCPFIDERGSLCVHTDSYPVWKVYSLDPDTGKMTPLLKLDLTKLSPDGHLRCSTTWREYNKRYYLVGLHLKRGMTYRTILVLVDKKTLAPALFGKPFCQGSHDRIQFLSGLDVDEKNVYLAYGIGDKRAVVERVSRDDVNAYFSLINGCAKDYYADLENKGNS